MGKGGDGKDEAGDWVPLHALDVTATRTRSARLFTMDLQIIRGEEEMDLEFLHISPALLQEVQIVEPIYFLATYLDTFV